LICGINAAVAILSFHALPSSVYGGSCDSTREIISNNMVALAGNSGTGDTLWVASNDPTLGLGVNDTIAGGQGWSGQYLSCYPNYGLQCLAFGGGTVTALLVPLLANGSGIDPSRPNLLWHRTLGASTDTVSIQFNTPSGPIDSFAGNNSVYSGGNFYFSCTKGGIVKWNPSASGPKGLTGILPGDPLPFALDSVINMNVHPLFGTISAAIRSIDLYGDSALVASAASRIWIYNYVLNTWDSTTVTMALSNSMTFDSLSLVFANGYSQAPKPLLYALIYYTAKNALDSGLFRYHYGTKTWSLLLSAPQTIIAPASRGCFYAVDKGYNRIQVFRDSLADADTITPPLQPIVNEFAFLNRLNITVIPQPQQYNDIVFIPTHDSTGHLFIATGTGLYSSWTEVPGITTDSLAYTMRPAKTISGGLSETYAVPGILTSGFSSSGSLLKSYTTFVYKLTRDANVTIKVYDYNMQLTRLVINNQPRKASTTSGRSTNAALDIWDGRTDSGRLAAPGIYYYKITASTGERSFGKIVVAKAM